MFWRLIAIGIENVVRGTINYLTGRGRQLMAPSTASEAAEIVTRRLWIEDQAERDFVRTVATEQQRVIDAAQRIQRGQIVGNLSQIPISSAYPPEQADQVRYLVVVRTTDPVTGERIDFPQEIYSDVPILRDDLLDMARERVRNRDIQDTPGVNIDDVTQYRIVSTTIVSVTRRG